MKAIDIQDLVVRCILKCSVGSEILISLIGGQSSCFADQSSSHVKTRCRAKIKRVYHYSTSIKQMAKTLRIQGTKFPAKPQSSVPNT